MKHGTNPFVHINPGLDAVLKAHAVWKTIRYRNSPWFVPGKLAGEPATRHALAHALRRLLKQIGRKITSYGMRAFYVLIRRSWGIDVGVIAVKGSVPHFKC